jgi:hypothetical protein
MCHLLISPLFFAIVESARDRAHEFARSAEATFKLTKGTFGGGSKRTDNLQQAGVMKMKRGEFPREMKKEGLGVGGVNGAWSAARS